MSDPLASESGQRREKHVTLRDRRSSLQFSPVFRNFDRVLTPWNMGNFGKSLIAPAALVEVLHRR
jgi:hypothetical protein